MKKVLFSIFLFLLFSSFGLSQNQLHFWDWFRKADTTGYQVVHDVAVDRTRNAVYVVGGFEGEIAQDVLSPRREYVYGSSVRYDTVDIQSSGGKDGFLAKFDTLGALEWMFNLGGSDNDEIFAVDVDTNSGSIYIGGYAGHDWFDFRHGAGYLDGFNRGQSKDAFIACYDYRGVCEFAHRDGGDGDDYCYDVSVNQNDNEVTYIGSFYSNMELNGYDTGPYDSNRHMFVATRRKSNGNGVWRSFTMGINGNYFQKGIALARDNNYVYLLGEFIESFTIGNQVRSGGYGGVLNNTISLNYTSSTDTNIFFASLDRSTGATNYVLSIESPSRDYAGDIKVRGNSLYIGGGTGSTASYNGTNGSASISGTKAFVSIHNLSNGNLLSGGLIEEPHLSGSNTVSKVNSITFSGNDLVIGGQTNGTINFANNINNSVASSGGFDGFVSFYSTTSSTPTFLEVKEVSGLGNNIVNGIAGMGRKVYVGGQYEENANLNTDHTMTSVNAETGFVSLLAPRNCQPYFNYPSATICNTPFLPDSITTSGGVFSQIGNNLTIDPTTGAITNITNVNTSSQVIYTTFTGCADTITLTPDNIPPTINFNADTITLYASSNVCGALVDVENRITYNDNCTTTTITETTNINNTNLSVNNNTPYKIKYTATDPLGNNASDSIYVYVLDTIRPQINNCNDITEYLTAESCTKSITFSNITSTDNCNIQSTSWNYGQGSTSSNTHTFSTGTTPVTYTATDINGNTNICSFNVSLIDTISPQIQNCITNQTVYLNQNNCDTTLIFNNITSTDNCSTQPTTSWNYEQGGTNYTNTPHTFSTGTTTATYTATDVSGNSNVCRFDIIVIDTITPIFTNCIGDTTIYTSVDNCDVQFNHTLQGLDNCAYTISPSSGSALLGSNFPLGTTQLNYNIEDNSGNSSTCSFSVIVEIDSSTIPSYKDSIPSGLCVGDNSLNLIDYINGSQNGNFYINGSQNGTYTPSSNATTKDTIMYIYGVSTCRDTITHYIELHDLTSVSAGLDDTICGLSYSLSADTISSTGLLYSWETISNETYAPSSSTDTATVTVLQEGLHSFIWTVSKDQCKKSDTVSIMFYGQPTANAGEDQIVEQDYTNLNAIINYGTGYWYVANSEGYIEDSTIYNTEVSELNLGLNTFIWVVSNGICPLDSAEARVFYDLLTIPNAFSPNGDGVNDLFYIKGFDLYSNARLTVIDRWGEEIFFTDTHEYWDGTYKGKEAVEDTYFYILYVNGKEHTGYIELKR